MIAQGRCAVSAIEASREADKLLESVVEVIDHVGDVAGEYLSQAILAVNTDAYGLKIGGERGFSFFLLLFPVHTRPSSNVRARG